MNYRSCSLATLLSSLTIAGVFQVSAATPTSKPAARKPAAPTSVVQAGGFLEAGPATVSAEKVNLRARPDVDSEPVGRLSRNDSVRVIEEIRNPKPGPGEPARWAKIALPESAHVWVFGDFLDKAASTVKVPRLNLRSGPGENHAVIGTLDKGAAVKKVEAKGDWWRIEAPASAVAYVAANLLQTKPVSNVVAVRSDNGLTPGTPLVPPGLSPAPIRNIRPLPVAPPPNTRPLPPVKVDEMPPDVVVALPSTPGNRPSLTPPVLTPPAPRPLIAPNAGFAGLAPQPPTPPPAPTPIAPAPIVAVEPAKSAPPAPVPAGPMVREPGQVDLRPVREDAFVKRVVSREGRVRRTYNIQSPTDMVLENLQNGRIMNYLYSTSTNINFQSYRGRVVTVVGEEALDERWPNIPVIRVETLQTAP